MHTLFSARAFARAAAFYLLALAGTASALADVKQYSEAEMRHIAANCRKEAATDSFLYSDDFAWDQTRAELEARYKRLYESEKRLKKRAFYDEDTKEFLFEMQEEGRTVRVPIAARFLRSVQAHIEEALRLKYVDAIIFSDMGHTHFFMPEEVYAAQFSRPEMKTSQIFAGYFAEPQLKVLYHTAEQVKLSERGSDGAPILNLAKWDGWRYYTRNIVGRNDGSRGLELHFHWEDGYNTVREYEGHHYGYGINLSANKNGCFPFIVKGETYWFDLSLEDIQSNPNSGGGM